MIINPTIIAKPDTEIGERLMQGIRWLEWFDFEVVLFVPPMLTYLHSVLLANDWAWWTLYADWNGCHGFHCSEYLQCLLYNPFALPYAFPPAFSTPTSCLGAFVFVGSGVHVRSGFWGSIVSLLGVSSAGGAPGTLSMGRSLVGLLIDGHWGTITELEPWWLGSIPACRW